MKVLFTYQFKGQTKEAHLGDDGKQLIYDGKPFSSFTSLVSAMINVEHFIGESTLNRLKYRYGNSNGTYGSLSDACPSFCNANGVRKISALVEYLSNEGMTKPTNNSNQNENEKYELVEDSIKSIKEQDEESSLNDLIEKYRQLTLTQKINFLEKIKK